MKYKETGIEWLGKIPEHWKVDRIKDKTLNVVGGDWGSDPESEAKGKNIVVLRVSDLDDIYFSYDDLTIRKIKESSIRNRKINKNCLVIEKSGGGEKQLVGRVGYPKELKFDAISSNFMAKIEFDDTVDLRFVNYMFSSLYESKINFPFVQQTTGIQNLNVGYYLTTKVSFPTKQEQIAIANYLDRSCERIDEIIHIKERQIKKIDEHLKAKTFELLTGKVYESKETNYPWFKSIPVDWKIMRLKSIVSKVNSGVTPKGGATSYLEEGIPLIRSQNIKLNKLDLSDVVFISEATHNRMKNSKVKNGDVLLNITGASLGRCYFVEEIEEANVNQHVCILRPNHDFVETKYLYYLINSKIGQSQIFSGFKGSGREGLNFEAIKAFRFPLPKKEKQIKIINRLDKLSELIYDQKAVIRSQIKSLKKYRKSLIHECVTGKKLVTKTPQKA